MRELKQSYVHIKLTETEKEKLKEIASGKGMTISQYVRTYCIYGNLEHKGVN